MSGAAAARCLLVALMVPAALHAAPERPRPVRRFALVVGNNVGPAHLPLLRYADDDAARLYEFLVGAGYRARLMTVLDGETQNLMPGVVAVAQPPTRAALEETLRGLWTEISAARAAGAETELLFAFAGHGQGSAEQGGAIFLLDGLFTRADLMELVVRPSPADFNHVIIDACDSYFMVAARGGDEAYPDDRVAGPTPEQLVSSYLAGDGVMQDPRTGFMVSTNQAAQSHEYDGFRAGVFSHVMHSAMAGAADSDRDGRVEYTEVLAYAAAASQEIKDPRARLAIHGRAPPRDVHRPLVDLRHATFAHYLRLGPELEGRIHVEDARSVRYADLHKTRGSEVLLALVDSPSYLVVKPGGEARITLSARRPGAQAPGGFRERDARARGPLETSLRQELFAVPYDGSFYRGYVASRGLTPARTGERFMPEGTTRPTFIPPRPPLAIPGLAILGVGGLFGVGAGITTLVTTLVYNQFAEDVRRNGVYDEQQAENINRLRLVTGLLIAAGISALAVGGILVAVELLWPARKEEL
ncbi:MAG: caspase family protein [Myxococcota bacterium]